MFAHRSIVHEGWKAVCPYPGPSLAEGVERGHPFGTFVTEAILDQLDADDWELYHLDDDPAECHDVAAEHPDKLAELRELWWSEAERYGALPIAGSGIDRLFARRPRVGGARQVYELFPGGSPVSFAASPRVNNRPHSITAHVTIPDGRRRGRAADARQPPRRLRVLRGRRAAALRAQLPQPRALHGVGEPAGAVG